MTFNRYQVSGKKNTVNVTKDLLTDSFGDVDTAIVIAAIVKLSRENHPSWETNSAVQSGVKSLTWIGYIGNRQKALISNYFFGNTNYTKTYSFKSLNDAQIKRLVEHYKNGDISNLPCAFSSSLALSLGIIHGHAYTIKDLLMDADKEYYVELVNPWDDNDVVRLPLAYLKTTDFYVLAYGYTDEEFNTYL